MTYYYVTQISGNYRNGKFKNNGGCDDEGQRQNDNSNTYIDGLVVGLSANNKETDGNSILDPGSINVNWTGCELNDKQWIPYEWK